MSDEAIPEDVREAAIRAFYVEGFPGGDLPTAVMEQDILAMIARAILAERERCAKIAEATTTFDWKGGDEWAAGYVDGKNAVASSIRSSS